MSTEPITDLATAVAVMGALPMPAGPPQPATPRWHQLRTELARTFRDYMPETARTKAVDLLDEALLECTAEIQRLKAELERLDFLERTTLPELRRTVQHHEDGKKRWRDRAREAEAMVYELQRPAELKRRNEVRSSYVELISQAEQDDDHEGAATLSLQLRACESMWQRTDEEAGR